MLLKKNKTGLNRAETIGGILLPIGQVGKPSLKGFKRICTFHISYFPGETGIAVLLKSIPRF